MIFGFCKAMWEKTRVSAHFYMLRYVLLLWSLIRVRGSTTWLLSNFSEVLPTYNEGQQPKTLLRYRRVGLLMIFLHALNLQPKARKPSTLTPLGPFVDVSPVRLNLTNLKPQDPLKHQTALPRML